MIITTVHNLSKAKIITPMVGKKEGNIRKAFTVQRIQLGPPEVFLPIIRRVQNKRIGVAVSFRPITMGVKFN